MKQVGYDKAVIRKLDDFSCLQRRSGLSGWAEGLLATGTVDALNH
ncbi:Hypothetical protein OINT_2001498 [Brucella intermedia LMG 3301]|uniref:Uncharacterized protein n=1 Tax=Brucella intermedia LMG 3301 TaxID=641118 RepID=C4WPT0_9HYPH|nr:Hypothetical protein OINT_2001498 [Brucella intermedia LMG 3301]